MCSVNKTDLTITLPNGSEIIFLGADDPERIKSFLNPAILWYEEISECKDENEFDQLVLRIRSPYYKNQIFLSLNPTSKSSFVYKRWFASGAQISDDTYILKTTYKDNKFLPKDYIDNLEHLISTNDAFYRIYTLGEWTSLDKLVYNNWKVEDFSRDEISGTHAVGLDWGFVNDPSAIVDSVIDEEKNIIYICREKCFTDKTNDQIAVILKEMGLAKSLIIGDSAEPKSIAELKKSGILHIRPSVKGPDSIIHGIQKIMQYQIIVHPSCVHTIEELENYAWKKDKKTGEYINEPEDAWNHCLDALRYSMQALKKVSVGGFDKRALGI